MAIRKNYGPWTFTGDTLADRPSPDTLRDGVTFFDVATQTIYYVIVASDGTHAWVNAGSGGSGATWPKYVVSNNPNVPAPYETVQAAIAAYNTDSPAGLTPAVVLVHPGAYDLGEGVIVPPFVSVVGLGDSDLDVVITGSFSVLEQFSTETVPTATFANFTATSLSNSTRGGFMQLWRVKLTDGFHALNINEVDPIPTVVKAGHCTFNVASIESAGVGLSGRIQMTLEDCDVNALSLGDYAVVAYSELGDSSLTVRNSRLAGRVQVRLSPATVTDSTVETDAVAPFVLRGNAPLTIRRSTVLRGGEIGPLVVSDVEDPGASVSWTDVATSGGPAVDVDVVTAALPLANAHGLTELSGPGPFTLTTATGALTVIDNDASDVAAALPGPREFLDGVRLTIRRASDGTGSITFTPATGTIDGGASLLLGDGGAGPAWIEIQSNYLNNDWALVTYAGV